MIKEVLFRVKATDNILFVIDSLSTLNEDKKEEYKAVNLIWTISDHLKMLVDNQELKDTEKVWRRLFGKLYWLGLHSNHGETKQSCIHTFTQILAESASILGLQTCSAIIRDIYLELFYVLLSLNEKSPPIEGTAQAEMAKVAIKNWIKMVKKCISD